MTELPHLKLPDTSALSSVLPEPVQGDQVSDAQSKAVQVRKMFDRIAATYDPLNNFISLGFHKGWKRQACGLLNLKPGARVLDVCTGTGDLIADLLPLVGSQGSVHGLDFSANMLAFAHQRYAAQQNVTLIEGDALALPFPEHYFDAAIISFGLRNVTDIPQALSEMHRVIKPGGWMVNLDTCPNPILPGMKFYFSKIMPIIGGALAKDAQAYRYLSESTRHFLTPPQLKLAFESTGCSKVISKTLMLGSVSLQAGRKIPKKLESPSG